MSLPAPTRNRAFSRLRPLLTWGGRLLLVAYFAAALLILVGRHFLMPEIATQRELVERQLSEVIGLPVAISGLSAGWPGLRPHLAIDGMRILDAAGRPALSLDRVEVDVGWATLWLRELRLHRLEIFSPVLDIRRAADGAISIAGLPLHGDGVFADWLLAQDRVVVRDARVLWHDAQRGAPVLELHDLDFELRNAGRHHSFGFAARPPEAVAERLDIRGNLIGRDPDRIEEWRGELYVDLAQADLAAWAPWIDLPLEWTRGRGGLRVWLEFARREPLALTAELRLADVAVRLRPDLPALDLAYLEGRLSARQTPEGHVGELRRFTLATRDGIVVPPTDVRLSLGKDKAGESGTFSANGFDLAVLAALAGRLPLPEAIHARLRDFAPRGSLADLELDWHGPIAAPERWRVKGRFEALALAAWRELPGFAGLSGQVEGDEKSGRVALDSRGARLTLPAVFPEPTLVFERIEADLGWRARDGALELNLSRAAFRNADARGEMTGSYRHTGKGPGEIDLTAKLVQASGNAVWRYMPLAVNQDARDWIRASILGGRSETVSLRLKGPLADFPFRGGKGGIFQVKGTIQGVTLDYAEGWPQMTGIDGELLFEGERMTIRGRRAQIMGVALTDIVAEIPDLEANEEILLVRGRANGPTQRFLDFIEASPVGGMIDHFTEPMRASGNGELQLKLTMPLRQVANTGVDGRYRFAGNDLRVLPELPLFAAAQGEFAFTADRLTAKNLRAVFLGAPLTAEVATAAGGTVHVSASGRVAPQILRRQPGFEDLRVLDHLSGEAPWRASVTIKKPGADVLVESNLDGLSSSLPAPFNKSARVELPLRVAGHIDPRGDSWSATLGGLAALHLQAGERGWRGRAFLGPEATRNTSLPERGVTLSIAQAQLDIDAWRAVLGAEGSLAARGGAFDLTAVDLRADSLRWDGRKLHDVRATAARQRGNWRIDVDSREAVGHLLWEDAGPGRVSGRFARLWLPPDERAGGAPARARSQAGTLPAVDLAIDDLRLNAMRLGSLRLVADTREGAWQGRVDIANDAARLEGKLRWRPSMTTVASHLDFTLNILDSEKLLLRLGMPDAIRRGAGRIEGALAWNGQPQEFALLNLSGKLRAEIERGQFKKLEPGVGRLLGVLSLQALPRRIVLDFRDVFSEGFAFDSIAGEADIARGQLRTEDLQIRGPAARIRLSGQASLIDETQDLKVRVQPAIGDTVALGAMLANPVVGAVTWLAQKALNDPLDQAFAYEFAVTGPWADPKVEKIIARPPAPERPPSQ